MHEGYIESVPNFSEGRNPETIRAIACAFQKYENVQLLNIDSNASANRTVYTIVGPTKQVLNAVSEAILVATERIDMRVQKGSHPRIGAADVVPFIPLNGISVEELDQSVHALARQIGEDLGLPIFMYENSASREERKNLANIRKGEYEGLREKMKEDRWQPDYGPKSLNIKSGASVMGVRDFLIAYNINIDTRDGNISKMIANELRSSHRNAYDEKGQKYAKDFKLPFVKAISWFIDEFDTYHISTNLTNFRITGMHHVYEACKRISAKHGVSVSGSELIGLLPERALMDAGKHYCGEEEGCSYIEKAVETLNLNDVKDFVTEERILDRLSGIKVT